MCFTSSMCFIPGLTIYNRKMPAIYSHFTYISTKLNDKDLLIQSLLDVNPNLIIDDIPALVVGYNGNEVMADVIIRQENGMDIGFTFNQDSYEMVSDLQFWNQSVPPNVFLEKVSQRYSLHNILDSLDEEGFYTDCIQYNTETSCIELQASRYQV